MVYSKKTKAQQVLTKSFAAPDFCSNTCNSQLPLNRIKSFVSRITKFNILKGTATTEKEPVLFTKFQDLSDLRKIKDKFKIKFRSHS